MVTKGTGKTKTLLKEICRKYKKNLEISLKIDF